MKTSLLCLALMTAAAAGATEPPPIEKPAARPAGQQKQVDKLAEEFGVKKEDVSGLRDKGLGWGEVRHALSLSRKTGKPVGEILKMRDGGMGWGEIAKKEGVKLGPERAGKGAEPRVPEPKGDRGMKGGDRGHDHGGKGNGRGK